MNYVELREQADELAEIWGYSNSQRPPDWYKLVNQAYIDLTWEAEAIKGPRQSFSSVIDTPEYDLSSVITGSTRNWKAVLEVTYDGTRIWPVDEAVVRRDDADWLTAASGASRFYWMPRPNILRLYPTPSAVKTVYVYGVWEPVQLSADTDTPVIPLAFHEAIPVRAAYLHAKKYAKSDTQKSDLAQKVTEFNSYLERLKKVVLAGTAIHGSRRTQPIEPDRVSL